jgi:hypothetical protein
MFFIVVSSDWAGAANCSCGPQRRPSEYRQASVAAAASRPLPAGEGCMNAFEIATPCGAGDSSTLPPLYP